MSFVGWVLVSAIAADWHSSKAVPASKSESRICLSCLSYPRELTGASMERSLTLSSSGGGSAFQPAASCDAMAQVSAFVQTANAKKRMRVLGCRARRVLMSKTDQFWQYAKEAIFSACHATADEDQQCLLELARVWMQAALLRERGPLDDCENLAEIGAA